MDEALYVYCSQCDAKLNEDSSYWYEDETFCENCLDEETFICICCNERFCNDDNCGDDNTPLCNSCFDNYYTNCERCNRLILNDDAHYTEGDEYNDNPYCYNCYDYYESVTYLHSYSYKPVAIFYGDGNRYFGVELEIDNAGKDDYNAKLLCNIANKCKDNIYIKSDSSLDDGLEIVTHPMTLEYHTKEMPWKLLTGYALELGYSSHKSTTCGLHIHVNRNSFSDSPCYQDECIARILYVVERFWQELLRFSRRTESQLNKWCQRYGYKSRPADILDTAKNSYSGRYTCVNITNYDTIEFRIFRGTLKYNTLIATLQLVNEICDVAFYMSDEEVARLGWCDFIERISVKKSPELITYLKERRLYINEPVSVINEEE